MTVNGIKGLIYAKFGSCVGFASAVGWSRAKVSGIVNGTKEPRLKDIQEMAHALEEEPYYIASFFLPPMSQKCDAKE